MDKWRKSQKKREAKRRKTAKKEAIARVPMARRDSAPLLLEIEKLAQLQRQEKLDGPGRFKLKRLVDQFEALRKAREKAGLPTLILPKYVLGLDEEEFEEGDRKVVGYGNDQGEPLPPFPDDEPYETGVPGLPPYDLAEKLEIGNINKRVIESAPIISHRVLDEQVDQFLRDL